jgi:hypothetical protein
VIVRELWWRSAKCVRRRELHRRDPGGKSLLLPLSRRKASYVGPPCCETPLESFRMFARALAEALLLTGPINRAKVKRGTVTVLLKG